MIYVVQPGGTLWRIARQYGVTAAQIAALNQIPDPDVLVVGQALLILNRIKQGHLTIDVGAMPIRTSVPGRCGRRCRFSASWRCFPTASRRRGSCCLLGQSADRVLLMTYEWGYKYGPPMAVAPLEQVRRVVECALTEIPAEKISLGLPNYGYDWPLPFTKKVTVARTIGNVEAVEIAKREKTNILFDWESKSPWFRYTDDGGVIHEVWFEDVRSWKYKLDLLREYGLAGVGIWQLMQLFFTG